jgi:hypothetical protein
MPYNAMALPPHGMMVTSYQNDHADDWRIYVYDMVKKTLVMFTNIIPSRKST